MIFKKTFFILLLLSILIFQKLDLAYSKNNLDHKEITYDKYLSEYKYPFKVKKYKLTIVLCN